MNNENRGETRVTGTENIFNKIVEESFSIKEVSIKVHEEYKTSKD